MNILLLKKDKQ